MREVSLSHANTYSRRQFISRGPPLILRENSRTHNFIEISRVFHGSVPGLTRTFFYSVARKMAAARDARSAGVTIKNPPRFISFFLPFLVFFSLLVLPLFFEQSYNFGPRVYVILFECPQSRLDWNCHICFNQTCDATSSLSVSAYDISPIIHASKITFLNIDIFKLIIRIERTKYYIENIS